ncbi:hypothetical protein RchiOBHm_Chr5g0039611 [Rosa chinensis]|uniref:Uncharacterized protein n=1 Tax=Rosa chinensis TaxID=74649 RepID=A0A2P6QCA6_ROSCH|nr:hypothetical protein RchiOBHm_Chr5g0039611 [Rosa chinensis]
MIIYSTISTIQINIILYLPYAIIAPLGLSFSNSNFSPQKLSPDPILAAGFAYFPA